MKRPDIVTDDHLAFLDALREEGDINMFGSARYVERKFSVSKSDAQQIVVYWLTTFGETER